MTDRDLQARSRTTDLFDQLASLPGYDAARCGERVARLTPSPAGRP